MKESLNTINQPTPAAAEPLGGLTEQRNHKHYECEMHPCHNRDFGRMVLDPLTPRQPSGEHKRHRLSPRRPQTSPESGSCCIAGIPQEMVKQSIALFFGTLNRALHSVPVLW